MIYPLNATSQSIDVQIVDDTGLAVTGLVATTFPTLTYSLAGANADVAFPTLSDLATITTAWVAGGVKERGGGVYRLDLPNGVFSSAGEVKVRGEVSGKHVLAPWIDVGGVPLSASGLDAVVVESGLNARQALSVIASSCAGVLAGAGTTTIVISAAGVSATTRITATVDGAGNRTAVVLSPPA